VVREPWDDDPDQWLDAPPAWVRWTTGTGMIVIAVTLLVPYAWWVRLVIVAGLVLAVRMLRPGNDN
jgi:hypothetical protein